ncbi:hypothetical protein B5P22_27385 [Pseudomonas tolaasii]|uniref:hypothetical protein n=1 Tax=Pseudomonas tolaasii TaxID=29442 RepID=UPI0009B6D167|nr:hypothetical protein [Pseudomonas tolaasii]ARB30870.1 hypothetical protein B5P22_27385 [Pseudomonas tolaasii]
MASELARAGLRSIGISVGIGIGISVGMVPMLYGRQEILYTRPLPQQRAGEIHGLLHKQNPNCFRNWGTNPAQTAVTVTLSNGQLAWRPVLQQQF